MIADDLDRALQRSGDDLYRLALLLTDGPNAAQAALARAIGRLPPAQPVGAAALATALVAALPPDRLTLRPRHPPAWTQRAGPDAARAAAISRLPREQRLALGLALLLDLDRADIAAALDVEPQEAVEHLRAALETLAPTVPGLPPAPPEQDEPEACRAIRATLAGDHLRHDDPAARGHLAICPECRAAGQRWGRVREAASETLRTALRDERMPEELRAPAARAQSPAWQRWLPSGRAWQALPLLAVAALIVALVLPRHNATTVSRGGAAAPALAPRQLVDRALATLYAPPPGGDLWHGTWDILWVFDDGTSTVLRADLWRDQIGARHRVQLVHQQGGGPYEFELADGTANIWYAISSGYFPSLYPSFLTDSRRGVLARAAPDERRAMLQARLESGAWGIAAAYLRQAQTAPALSNWGRRTTPDGAVLDIIGFEGASPLAPPPDARGEGEAAPPVRVLLAIDRDTGALREVSELVGPAGSQQVGRTTWRFVGEERLTTPSAIAQALDLKRAWNGTIVFSEEERIIDPRLPLLDQSAILPLTLALEQGVPMPTPPPDAEVAALFSETSAPATHSAYIGGGRRLFIRAAFNGQQGARPGGESEQVTVGDVRVRLRAAAPWRYDASIDTVRGTSSPLALQIAAFGYTRAELLDTIRSLAPLSLATIRSQARLFISPAPNDPAALDALLTALPQPSPPAAGMVRHLVERSFTRHDQRPDPLADPYHAPPYGGKPERAQTDYWLRADPGALAIVTRAESGALIRQVLIEPARMWTYDPLRQETNIRPLWGAAVPPLLDRVEATLGALQLIACGGTQLEALPSGGRAVQRREELWASQSCMRPYYPALLLAQIRPPGSVEPGAADGPFLADIAGRPLVARAVIAANGRLARFEVRAGEEADAPLLEAYDLLADEELPRERAPVHLFDGRPPEAVWMRRWPDGEPGVSPGPRVVTITETARLLGAPVFVLDDERAMLMQIEMQPQGAPDPGYDGSVFETALRAGVAARMIYILADPASSRTTFLYQGPAGSFGAFLRGHATWRSSTPIAVTVGNQVIDAWRVQLYDGTQWSLMERDGTLLAMSADIPLQQDALARLAPAGRPVSG
jgi:DNA-directed RNA polymerase specialized sigma24 family protein